MKKKKCSKCRRKKEFSEFYKDKNKKDGRCSYCKRCSQEHRKKWGRTPNGINSRLKAHLKCRYGLTISERKSLYINQNGCCVVCGNSVPYDKIHVDHDHKTGKVRELLCVSCNLHIGFLEKNDFWKKAKIYLRKHGTCI